MRELSQSLFAMVREFERFRAAIARERGVSVTELRALSRVVEGGRITPKLLAQQVELTTGAVTALTDRLVDAGLVAREANPEDRRSLLLAATPAGVQLVDAVVDSFEAVVKRASLDADEARLEEFSAMLRALVEHSSEIVIA